MEALRWVVLLLAIVSALAYLVLAVLAFNQQFLEVDRSALALAQSARHPHLESLIPTRSDVGSGYARGPWSVAFFFLLWPRAPPAAQFAPAVVVGAFVFFALPKGAAPPPPPRLSAYGFP